MHALQPVLPNSSWYVPASHGLHDSCSFRSLYVPGAQSVADPEPTGQNVPSKHTTHCSTLDMIAVPAGLCLPRGHGSAAAAPGAQ